MKKCSWRFVKSCPFIGVLLCGSNYLQAQSEPEEIVVSSSKFGQSLRTIGTSVAVLNREQIEAIGDLSVLSILETLPAISVSRNGGLGSTSSLRIRGEEGFRTLTVIDGLRLSDPSNTQISAQLEHLTKAGLERIEVLRGPQGLSYGADAGGVVNISTVVASVEESSSARISAELGSLDTKFLQMDGRLRERNYYAGASANLTSSAGFNHQVVDDQLQDRDGYENDTVHATIGFDDIAGFSGQWTGRYVDAQSQYDSCFAFTVSHQCLADYQMDAQRLGLSWQGGQHSHALSYSTSTTRRDYFAEGSASFAAEGGIDRWDYQGGYSVGEPLRLVFGADVESASNEGYQRDNLGVYTEALFSPRDALHVTAGVRLDDNDDFGEHVSYRVSAALIQDVGPGEMKYRASVGTGFRAPSLFEVSYNRGPFSFPPASTSVLVEENSQGYELGVEWYGENLSMLLTWFDQEVENAIIFDLSGFSGYLQDSGLSTSRGLESALMFSFSPGWSLNLNHTYNKTSQANGERRIRRPEHIVNLGFHYSPDSLPVDARISYRRVVKSEDEQAGVRVALDNYDVVSAMTRYEVSEKASVFLRLENAFNSTYQEVVGFNVPERAIYAGFHLNLGL